MSTGGRYTSSLLFAFSILVIGFLIALAARKSIFNLAFALKIDIKEVHVRPLDIHRGGQATCQIKFQTKGPVYLDNITALILARETAQSGVGSSTSTRSYTLYKKQYRKSYGEELEAGRWVTFECPVPVPSSAPPTFITPDNSIHWSLRLKITCKRWPSWEKTIPITVSA